MEAFPLGYISGSGAGAGTGAGVLRGFVCVVGAVEEAEVVGCLVGLVSYYCRWQGWLLILRKGEKMYIVKAGRVRGRVILDEVALDSGVVYRFRS